MPPVVTYQKVQDLIRRLLLGQGQLQMGAGDYAWTEIVMTGGGGQSPWIADSGSQILYPRESAYDLAVGGLDTSASFHLDVDGAFTFNIWGGVVNTPTSAHPTLKVRPSAAPDQTDRALLELQNESQVQVARWEYSGKIVLASDTNLYRSAADSLMTDDMFVAGAGLKIGAGAAGVDYTLTFDGETNDFLATWMEDEDYLLFADDLCMADAESIRWLTDTSLSRANANLLSISKQLCFEGDGAYLYKQAAGTMGLKAGHFYLDDGKQMRWATAGGYVVSDGSYMDLGAVALFRFWPRNQTARALYLDLATWSGNRLYLQAFGADSQLYANLHLLPYTTLTYNLGGESYYWNYLKARYWYGNETAYLSGLTAARIAAIIGGVDILHLDTNIVDCQKRFKLGVDQTKASAGELDYRSVTGRVELYSGVMAASLQMMHVAYRDYTEVTCTSPSETTLKTYTIAANRLGTTLGLQFIMSGKVVGEVGATGTVTLRFYFGGHLCQVWNVGAGPLADPLSTWVAYWNLHNAGAANTQKGDFFGLAVDTTGALLGSLPQQVYAQSSIDTTVAQNVVITCQLSGVTGTIALALEKVIIEAN